jgi:methionyl-tRNA synthetase
VLYVHGFVNVNKQKLSKSLGTLIEPKELVKRYSVDAARYFLTRHIPSYNDGDFSWELMEAAYNDELADQLGNAVSRTAAMINQFQKGIIGEIHEPEHDIGTYTRALLSCRFDQALNEVWDQIKGLNQYIDETKPWQIAKSADEEHLNEVLSYAAGSLLQISELLVPFMPDTAAKIQTVFGSGVIKPLCESLFPKDLSKLAPKKA